MDVKGSLESARRNEQKLKNAAWKCYSGLKNKSTNYAKKVLFLHDCHAQVVNMYEHFIIEWDKKSGEKGEE